MSEIRTAIHFPELKVVQEGLEVAYELDAVLIEQKDINASIINQEIHKLNKQLEQNETRLFELDKEIERLTNHADGIDYLVSVASGVLAGMIDIIWVGEFSLERGREWASDQVNDFVKKVAKFTGYKGNSLSGAVDHLEGFGAASDSNTMDFGGSLQHHLRDFAHHPTPVGLMFSLLTQFTEKSYGTDEHGNFKIEPVKKMTFIGENLPEKILFGVVYWFFHMVSDMAGSKSTAGGGTGLPGPLLSFAKELSSLPFFKDIEVGDERLTVWISKLFNGTLLAERDENGKIVQPLRFDLRAEIGVAYELGRQAIPVIINECVVRGFYFIRKFVTEIKEKKIKQINELNKIDWKKTLPANNRTIVRMLTISTGTLTALDLGDAAIRGALKSGGNYALFLKEFVLRVNFIGLGRVTIALGTDITMGIKRERRRNERIHILSEQLHLINSKIFYSQANVWQEAETTEKTILEAYEKMEETTTYFIETWHENRESMRNIGSYRTGIEAKNPELIDDITDVLKWG